MVKSVQSASENKLEITGDAPCPACTSRGRDSKGNHLILFRNDKGEDFGKCPKCGHYERGTVTANTRRVKTPEEIAEELEEVSSYPVRSLDSRRIPLGVAQRFGVRVGLSESDGTSVAEHYYPRKRAGQVVAYNVRSLDPKGFYYKGSPKGGTDPFGLDQASRADTGRNKLFIAEDELSAMSIYAVLDDRAKSTKWASIKPAVFSWSAGVGTAARDIQNHMDFIKQFKEVIYVHDNDEQGLESVEVVRALLPDAKFTTTSLKDANDMHMAGREGELFSALLFQSKKKSPDCAVTARDCLEEALTPPVWGKSYPWQGLTDLTFGQRDGELISVGGGVGTGKTLIAHMIAGHNIVEHGERVATCLLEETNGNSLKNIVGKIAGVPFHRPDMPFDRDLFMEHYKKVQDSLFLWNNKGQNDWESIVQAMRFWAVAEGVKTIFIDNLTTLVNHLAPTEQNTMIARISTESAGLADELGIRIFMFSHLNPPKGSTSHEEGAEVKETQFTGGRGLSRWSQGMWGFERNKQAVGDLKHNNLIRVLKDRNYGNTGIVRTQFDPATGKLIERVGDDFVLGAEEDDNQPF